jgi:hypothetical protein
MSIPNCYPEIAAGWGKLRVTVADVLETGIIEIQIVKLNDKGFQVR